ncbi:MAG: diadenylate cyclase CdaA [Bacteroidota bacterium]|nr:diadenylate cyclase CdaA [Bacteroidota bacterium]
MLNFLELGVIDIIDIILTAFLFYNVYIIIKRTNAIRIFIGLVFIYAVWLVVNALHMKLLGGILGYVTGVGALTIIIVFQQEIRKFFILLSNRYLTDIDKKILIFFKFETKKEYTVKIWSIAGACAKLAKEQIGALIVIPNEPLTNNILESGVKIDAVTSAALLQSIFAKTTPLHDGAVIINKKRISLAGCVLPLSSRKNFPVSFGLRHRAAAGMAESFDCCVISVSEERGEISWFYRNEFVRNLTVSQLRKKLEAEYNSVSENEENLNSSEAS